MKIHNNPFPTPYISNLRQTFSKKFNKNLSQRVYILSRDNIFAMSNCNEQITINGIVYVCKKDDHKDVFWHKSKTRSSQPIKDNDKEHIFVIINITWRNEKKSGDTIHPEECKLNWGQDGYKVCTCPPGEE